MKTAKTIEQLNADTMLDDTWVQWAGGAVYLWDSRKQSKLLASFDAHSSVMDKIVRWCLKNNYRCTQIHDGKIWL